MATNTPVQQTQPKIKKAREEMWWVILAKSKTLRFFAVSCEFILFLGGLWITFTVNDPQSKTWLGGNVNMIFLTVMGWAIDAAMPEAWLHVVIQHVEKKQGQLSWSKFVAIGISFLFIGNIVYSIMTSGDTTDKLSGVPIDAAGWILLALTILRIAIGFVYITVRQCQEWIDRQDDKSQANQTPPAVPTIDVEELVSKTIAEATNKLASSQAQMIADLSSRQEQAINLQRIEQQRLLTTIQEVKDTQQTFQIAGPVESKEEIVNTVLDRLQTLFVERQEAQQTRQLEAPKNTGRSTGIHASIRQQIGQTEIVKRPKRIDPEEVDAVVHPLLDKDRSLTHRKIAALPGVTYTETVVYASVKRWREMQPVVSGDAPEQTEGEVS